MFKIGEALVGKGDEVAHVDLMIGDKDSQVGEAFANGMTQLSQGHTPLLSVIRPNLPAKPYTLVVPKVTVEDLGDAEKIFGPAQAAVAKAVADSVEEGVIDEDQVEELLLVVSVFIHPEAEDHRRIYQYNYGATKLALKRALNDYPSNDKIMYDKDRAVHPMMGFRVPRLPKWNVPYLQIALDVPDLDRIKHVINELPESDKLILEAGTPLIKKHGTKVIGKLRDVTKKDFVIADLKTLDVGKVEVDLAFEEGADAVVASGLAEPEVLDKFIYEAKRLGIYSIVDTMNVEDPVEKLKQLKEDPEVVILHRCVDAEEGQDQRWHLIQEIKKEYPNVLVAVAGGINPQTAPEAIEQGADIIIVGRYITQAKDVKGAVREFLEFLGKDIDVGRVHVE